MFETVTITPLMIEAICGAASGLATARLLHRPILGAYGNALIGAIGGLALTWLAARMPGIGQFVGGVGSALDSAVSGTGGITFELLVGVGIAGLSGGAIVVLIVGATRRVGS